jgi:hypothetical protein
MAPAQNAIDTLSREWRLLARCSLTVVFVLVQCAHGTAKSAEAGTPHLVPDTSVKWGKADEYQAAVRALLMATLSDSVYARAITLPSFTPEWLIDVAEPSEGRSIVTLVEPKRHIWQVVFDRGDPKSIEAVVTSAPIDAEIARKVRAAFVRELRRVAYPSDLPEDVEVVQPDGSVAIEETIVVPSPDGTTHHFSAKGPGGVRMDGTVKNPSAGSGPAEITDLAILLREVVKASEQGPEGAVAKLRARLGMQIER